MNTEEVSKKDPPSRQQRYTSHALAEIRKFKHFPIFCYSAVLLDISLGGFKLEFTSEVNVSPGSRYWLNIPLGPLGIYAPKRIVCLTECRWFDSNRFRIGGVFIDISKTDKILIEQVINSVNQKNQL